MEGVFPSSRVPESNEILKPTRKDSLSGPSVGLTPHDNLLAASIRVGDEQLIFAVLAESAQVRHALAIRGEGHPTGYVTHNLP